MFKIGDKIRVVHLSDVAPMAGQISIGSEGEIIDMENDPSDTFPYYVKFEKENMSTWLATDEIKLNSLKVYIAAPFFSDEQINKVKQLEDALDQNQTIQSYFSPRKVQNVNDFLEPFTKEWALAIMENDISEVDKADIIIGIIDFDGSDSDSGTAYEIGYAIAKGKKTYLVNFNHKDMVNLMLTGRNTAYFEGVTELKNYDFNAAKEIQFEGPFR